MKRLNEIIQRVNDLFEGDLTDQDKTHHRIQDLGLEIGRVGDLERLRDTLYGLAGVIVTGFLERPVGGPAVQVRRALQLVPAGERDALEERAAIHEYDGGLERDDAERAAMNEMLRPFRGR